ncbi:MAG: ZIP family metal transporter [bacterium]|jgi:ZIP family zinc transporter
MSSIGAVTLIGTLAGVIGTGLGGLVSIIACNGHNRRLSFMLAFAGGIMLAVVFADLFPEAIDLGGIRTSVIGLALGVAMLLLLDMYLPHSHFVNVDRSNRQDRFLHSSLLLGIGIAMHNLPEGLAIGASYTLSEHLGIGLAIILALHNIPEGMAMGSPMKVAGIRNWRILLWTSLAGLPTGIGALAGALLGSVSPNMLSLALGIAAGAMMYVTFDELLPEAHDLSDDTHSATFGTVAGSIFGLLLILLLPEIQ